LNINSRFQKSGENVHRHGLAVSVVIFSEGDERFSCGISHAKSFHSYGATNKTSLGIVWQVATSREKELAVFDS
jgi:hypothetical protein